jgi:hypothetical protein
MPLICNRMRTHSSIHKHKQTDACKQTRLHMHANPHSHTAAHKNTNAHTYAHTHSQRHMQVPWKQHAHAFVDTHTRTRAHTAHSYTCTQAYTARLQRTKPHLCKCTHACKCVDTGCAFGQDHASTVRRPRANNTQLRVRASSQQPISAEHRCARARAHTQMFGDSMRVLLCTCQHKQANLGKQHTQLRIAQADAVIEHRTRTSSSLLRVIKKAIRLSTLQRRSPEVCPRSRETSLVS